MSSSAERDLDDDHKAVFFDEGVQQQFTHLIRNAREFIIFVTPYIELWVHLKDDMGDAIARKVVITFLIREGETPHRPQDLEWLYGNKVKVYPVPNLHAKIYLNEKTVLVSSMNVLRTSTLDSKEFAMIVKNEVDAKMFREYVSRLIGKANIPQTSHPIGDYVSGTTQKAPVTKSSHSIGNYVSGLIARTVETQSSHSIERQTLEAGTCIRSGHKVSFNTDKPFCADCYRQWAKYKKEDYEEKYCHSCGKSAKTTFAKPLCMACWKKSN